MTLIQSPRSKLEVQRISLIGHVRHISVESRKYKRWDVDTSNSNWQPAPVPGFTPSLPINPPPPATQLSTDVFFHRVLCSLHSSQTRSSHPLAPRRPCPSHPLSSHQGSCPYRPRCGVLRTTFFHPWIALDNRGLNYPPCRWGIPPRSVHLHRCAGPSLEEGELRLHPPTGFHLTSVSHRL